MPSEPVIIATRRYRMLASYRNVIQKAGCMPSEPATIATQRYRMLASFRKFESKGELYAERASHRRVAAKQ